MKKQNIKKIHIKKYNHVLYDAHASSDAVRVQAVGAAAARVSAVATMGAERRRTFRVPAVGAAQRRVVNDASETKRQKRRDVASSGGDAEVGARFACRVFAAPA
jgi:hypothetical protein